MLVDDKGREVVVLAAVFQAVLIVREDVNEIVAAVIAPRVPSIGVRRGRSRRRSRPRDDSGLREASGAYRAFNK